MIEQEFGVKYHQAHCSRLLRQLRYSHQKPIEKATQRDEAAIQAWKESRWEEFKKQVKAEGWTLLSVLMRPVFTCYRSSLFSHLCYFHALYSSDSCAGLQAIGSSICLA